MTDEVQQISLEDFRRIKLEPGDRFVLTVPARLTPELAAQLQATWAAFTSGAAQLLILEEGMKLGLINLESLA